MDINKVTTITAKLSKQEIEELIKKYAKEKGYNIKGNINFEIHIDNSTSDGWGIGRTGPYSDSNSDWSPTTYTIIRGGKEDSYIELENGELEKKIKGKLYLSNINKAEWFGDNVKKLFIAREPIKDMDKYGFKWITKLVPSYDLLHDYKKGKINWDEYYARYRKEVILNPNCKIALDTILNHLKAGEDIVLICYCQTARHCHRGILGEYFEDEGVEVINLDDYNMSGIVNQYDVLTDLPITAKQTEKILKVLLREEEFAYKILESNEIKLNSLQIRNLIDYALKNMDAKVATLLVKKYSNEIKTNVQDKLDSIVILKKLMGG